MEDKVGTIIMTGDGGLREIITKNIVSSENIMVIIKPTPQA